MVWTCPANVLIKYSSHSRQGKYKATCMYKHLWVTQFYCYTLRGSPSLCERTQMTTNLIWILLEELKHTRYTKTSHTISCGLVIRSHTWTYVGREFKKSSVCCLHNNILLFRCWCFMLAYLPTSKQPKFALKLYVQHGIAIYQWYYEKHSHTKDVHTMILSTVHKAQHKTALVS